MQCGIFDVMRIENKANPYVTSSQLDLKNASRYMNLAFKANRIDVSAELSTQTGKPTMVIKNEDGAVVRRIDGQKIINKMNHVDTYVWCDTSKWKWIKKMPQQLLRHYFYRSITLTQVLRHSAQSQLLFARELLCTEFTAV